MRFKARILYSLVFLLSTAVKGEVLAQKAQTVSSKNSSFKSLKKTVPSRQKKDRKTGFKIKVRPALPSLRDTIKKVHSKKNMADIFDSTLFQADENSPPSVLWLNDINIRKNRQKIMNTDSTMLEFWWKMNMETFQLLSTESEFIFQGRFNTKMLARMAPTIYGQGEIELNTSVGSIQRIYQSDSKPKPIILKEIMFLWESKDWLTLKFGAVNQSFLNAPLLITDTAFLSLVENFHLSKSEQSIISLDFQQSIPSTFSDRHNKDTVGQAHVPLFLTQSTLWSYNPNSYYKIDSHFILFYFNSLTSDIVSKSGLYGNSIRGANNPVFEKGYAGFYAGIEPSVQIFRNLGLEARIHYINNLMADKDFNQGLLYSLSMPFDITKNIRLTPTIEYFITHPDSTVGAYSNERYGQINKQGFIGEIVLNLYNRNMELGLRYLQTEPYRNHLSSSNQYYYLIFMRTNYVKI